MSEASIALLLLFVASGVTSFLTTGIVKRSAEQIGLVDRPDARKLHETEVPRIGGLAIIFGFGFPLLLLAGNPKAASMVSQNLEQLFAVLASGALIVGLGVYDDLVGADAPKKFAVQTAAALILVSFGFHFDELSIAGHNFDLGYFGVLASVFWIVGVINAVNFIDGIDSLCTVVSLTIAVTFAVIGYIREDVFSFFVMAALAGSLIGFLPWNRPPAKIFMGDSGSLFIGLLLAAISIARPSKSPTALIVGGPMLALAVPVIDTLMVVRERLGGERIPLMARIARVVTADRRHIHHILIERYGSTIRTIVSIEFVTVLFAIAAVLTVIQETKVVGYAAGIIGLTGLLFLRYWHRPHPGPSPVRERTA
ncbi:MAG TPA: MraY family glycosyltransferase [Thermoanaerobaculia bacterium]|nr:MraY family glycosyltransferase [Thermoanaerobaculia bacterium]